MKELFPVLISSLVTITALMVLIAFVYPQAFFLIPGLVPLELVQQTPAQQSDSTHPAADTTHSPPATESHAAVQDSSRKPEVHSTQQPSDRHAATSPSAVGESDSVKELVATIAHLRERLAKSATGSGDSLSDAEARTMAQIFEAMDPESAARILNNMDDFAVKQVLTAMKKRQSAKILAALNPKQAARILKVKGEL
ncbi:MAG: hypothetical protein C4326_00520 [Ignavibacteria bacterium]